MAGIDEKGSWELVDEAFGANTERLEVPGGWLYHVGFGSRVASMCFVPEPDKCPYHNQYSVKVCSQCWKHDHDEKVKNVREWISVENSLPDEWGMYLVRYHSPGISPIHVDHQVLHFNNKKRKWNTEYTTDNVTHWMELPELPK